MASHLRCTVEWLLASMSAQEFNRWLVWLEVERVGPAADEWRHAELLAAALNAPHVKPRSGNTFRPQDFARADPWSDAPPAGPQMPDWM